MVCASPQEKSTQRTDRQGTGAQKPQKKPSNSKLCTVNFLNVFEGGFAVCRSVGVLCVVKSVLGVVKSVTLRYG